MRILIGVAMLVMAACAPRYIPGTMIEDNTNNRTVFGLLGAYKDAIEQRNVDAVVSLCSTKYYEDNGNADPADDYGYSDLRTRILPETFKRLSEVRLELEVKEIHVEDNRAYADVRFTYQAKMALPAGEKWSSDAEINRIELARENGQWKIISGL